MQTELIQSTRTFKEFEKSFNHFFEECERGFTNELIISLLCRIFTPGRTVIGYKANVKEMYFIRQGLVEVFNNENDDKEIKKVENARGNKQKPILYLPKYSYFGDFHILFDLKSNMVYKTLECSSDDNKNFQEQLPDILFMCVEKSKIKTLIELFPQTAENIKERARERRHRFMTQKNINSIKFQKEKDKLVKEYDGKTDGRAEDNTEFNEKYESLLRKDVERYHTDEEAENHAS
jgi:hypothetical protein